MYADGCTLGNYERDMVSETMRIAIDRTDDRDRSGVLLGHEGGLVIENDPGT
jgi:hypothetical protein